MHQLGKTVNAIQKIKGAYAPFFWPRFCDLLRSSFIFFCIFLRSYAFNSFAIFGVSIRQHLPDLKSGTRPGFEKLLDGQSKKRGAVAPLVGVGLSIATSHCLGHLAL
jgi:hypothetical protein